MKDFKILNEILKCAEISTSEIAKSTGLSYPTISRVLRILKARKMIIKTGEEETSIGRRPEKVSFNNHYGYMMHLIIRENEIIGYLSDLRGNIIQKTDRKYNTEITPEILLKNISVLYQLLLSRGRKKDIKPLAVSVSIPGVVNCKERTVTRLPSVFGETHLAYFSAGWRTAYGCLPWWWANVRRFPISIPSRSAKGSRAGLHRRDRPRAISTCPLG